MAGAERYIALSRRRSRNFGRTPVNCTEVQRKNFSANGGWTYVTDDEPDEDRRQECTDLTATDYTDWRPNACTMTFGRRTLRLIVAWARQTPQYMTAYDGRKNAVNKPWWRLDWWDIRTRATKLRGVRSDSRCCRLN